MSSGSDQRQHAAGTRVIDEVRIALAMSGGIALTVYEAGVAHELWRAATALDLSDDEFGEATQQAAAGKGDVPASTYRAVLKKVGGQLVLDVLTGASAGGINAVALGSALSTGGNFGALHDLWLEEADIDKLEYRRGTVPASLLDSGVFRGPLRQALEKNQKRGATPARGKEDLILVVTRTNLAGRRRILTDALGHHAVAETKEDPIRFEAQDFCNAGKLDEFVNAALATSAFPVVFPPVQMGDHYYADGGLLDNQPVGHAIKAIRDKKAAYRTHRFVVFVEPNPESLKEPAARPAPSVAQVALQVPLLGVKGNIWNAVTDMEEFNRRRGYYAGLVGALGPERDQVATWLRSSTDETFQRAFTEIRFDELFLAHDAMRYARWKTIEVTAFPQEPEAVSVDEKQKAQWMRSVVDGTGEVDFCLRWLRALLREINRTIKDPTTPDEILRDLTGTSHPSGAEPSDKEALYDLLDRMLTTLYPRGSGALQSPYNIGRKIDAWQKWIEDKEENNLRPDLDRFVQEVRTYTAGKAAPVAADIKEQVGRRARAHVGFYQICLRVSGIREGAPAVRPFTSADLGEHLFTEFKQRDIVDYVLDAATDLHQKDDIHFVRVSPNDTNNLKLIGEEQPGPEVSLASVKLAGELFGHMGGFLEEWWRRNDYIWGRLDAAEIILKLLTQVYKLEVRSDALLSALQQEILDDEYWRYKQRHEGTKLPSKPAVDQPQHNREWIGYGWQTLASLYPDKITDVMRYLFDTSLALARGNPWVPANALDRVSRVLRALAVVVRMATWPTRAEGVSNRIRASLAWRLVVVGAVFLVAGFLFGRYPVERITGGLVTTLWITGVAFLIFVLGAFAGWRFWTVVPVTAVISLAVGMWAHARMMGTWSLPGWMDILPVIAVLLAAVFLWRISRWRPEAS